MRSRWHFFYSVLILFLAFQASAAGAETIPISTGRLNNVAIGGSDTTAYHRMYADGVHEHSQGRDAFTVEWNGATWHFASAASRDKFAAEPERYAPPYGGHCANALSLGEGLIRTNGKVWEFFGDDLYLFYAERGRKRWLQGDWQSYKAAADQAWQTILNGG